MKKQSLMKGTFILTAGIMASKLIGLLYIIPFYSFIGGSQNIALFTYAYIYYALVLEVTTIGVPSSIAKLIAKYNAQGKYKISNKLFQSGMIFMFIMGLVGFLVMYFGATMIAKISIADKGQTYSVADLAFVIQSLSWAVLLVPPLAMLRGFFQGNEFMTPSAVSQLTEQIGRIIFLLVGVYLVMNTTGDVVAANGIATYGATIGSLIGILTLAYYYMKNYQYIQYHVNHDQSHARLSLFKAYKEIIISAIPFVFIASTVSLFGLIDNAIFPRAMSAINQAHLTDDVYSIVTNLINKIVMVPVSLATAFSFTLLAIITRLFIQKQYKVMKQQIDKILSTMLYLVIPALFGIYSLAGPVYTAFYSYTPENSILLMSYIPLALVISIYSVTSMLLQGIEQQKWNIIVLIIGLIVKVSVSYPLITAFQAHGLIHSTTVAYLVMIVGNFIVLKTSVNYKPTEVLYNMAWILIASSVMYLISVLSYYGLTYFIDPTQRKGAVIIITICAFIGGSIYLLLTARYGLARKLLGSRLPFIAKIEKK